MEKRILAIAANDTDHTRQLARKLQRRFYVHFCDINSPMLKITLQALRPDAALIDLTEASRELACKVCELLHELKAVVIDASTLSDAKSRPFDKGAFFLSESIPEEELPGQLTVIAESGIALSEMLRYKPDANIGELLSFLYHIVPGSDIDETIERFSALGVPERWVIGRLFTPPVPAEEFESEQESEDTFFVHNAQEQLLIG